MVLGAAGLLLLLALPLVLGAAGLRAAGITWRTDPVSYGGWAWMVGALLLAALELLHLVTGVGSPGPVAAAALVLAAALWWFGRRVAPVPPLAVPPLAGPRESWPARAFFGAVLALALVATLHRALGANWTAIVRDDEAIYWARRAKLWFGADGFGGVYARALAANDLPNAGSPLLNPLVQLWAFDLAGRITHVVNRVPIQIFSLALILCAGGALRRAAGSWLAGPLLLLLVASAPAMIAIRKANSDVIVALGALVAADAFLGWRGTRAAPALGGLAACLLLWSKNEGLLYLAAFLGACLFLHGRHARALLAWPARTKAWCLPAVAVLVVNAFHNAWFAAKSTHGIGKEELLRLASGGERLPGILAAFARGFFTADMSCVPGVFLLLALLAPPARRGRLATLALAVGLAWLGLFLIYGTVLNPQTLIPKSLIRVLAQLVPLQLLWIAVLARALLARDGADAAHRARALP